MKYTVHVDIDLPREQVTELLFDPDHFPKWQRGFVRFEPLTGDDRSEGSHSKYVFQMGKRSIEMIETVVKVDLPDQLEVTYDAPGVFNRVWNRFESLGDDRTRWISRNEFRFTGLMRLLGLLMKSAFPKQTRQYMQDFRAFAEDGADVRDQP